MFGKVVGKVGQKWLVEWEDNQQTTVESSTLQLENQDAEDNELQDLERDDDTDSRLSGYFSLDEDEDSWLNEVTDFEDDEDPDYFPLKAQSTQHSQSSDNDDNFSQSRAPAKNVSLRQNSSASNKVPSIASDAVFIQMSRAVFIQKHYHYAEKILYARSRMVTHHQIF